MHKQLINYLEKRLEHQNSFLENDNIAEGCGLHILNCKAIIITTLAILNGDKKIT